MKNFGKYSGPVETRTYAGSLDRLKGRPITGIFKKDGDLMCEVKTAAAFYYQTKALGDDTFEGIFSVFGNVDSYIDRGHNGMFEKSMKERGPEGTNSIKMLWNHEMWDIPMGKVLMLKEVSRKDLPGPVLEAAPDATGGALVRRKYIGSDKAKSISELLSEGVITEMSYAFDAINYSFTEDDAYPITIRELHEVRLWECSDVLWGANDATLAAIRNEVGTPAVTPEMITAVFSALNKSGQPDTLALVEALKEILGEGTAVAPKTADDSTKSSLDEEEAALALSHMEDQLRLLEM